MERCFLCKSKQKDDIQYGEFLKNKHYGVHTFCLVRNDKQKKERKDNIKGLTKGHIFFNHLVLVL